MFINADFLKKSSTYVYSLCCMRIPFGEIAQIDRERVVKVDARFHFGTVRSSYSEILYTKSLRQSIGVVHALLAYSVLS